MLLPMLGRDLLQFGTITKHTWEWEIDERNLKIMNLTIFILKGYKIWGWKQQLSQHQICCQNIRYQKFLSKHQKWYHWCIYHPRVYIRKVPVLWRINYTSIDTVDSSNVKCHACFHAGRARQHPALVIYGSAKHAGMKKAASIFLKSRKFITAWFDNVCVVTPVVLPKNILQCTWSRLTVQCWWKTKK